MRYAALILFAMFFPSVIFAQAVGHIENCTAGENITAPAWVYVNAGDGKAYKANATTTANPAVGIVFANAVTDGACQIMFSGVFEWPAAAFTQGATYYLSASTSGDMTITAPANAQPLGVAVIGTRFRVDPKPFSPAQAWPVGSVFVSVVSTNPNTLLGYGTWTAFATGSAIVGIDGTQTEFDVVEETGGAKTHTLITSEMPSHNHTQDAHNHTQDAHNHTQDAHNHTQNAHTHNIGSANDISSTTGAGNIFAGSTTSVTSGSTTATNQSTTATNQSTTATNQNTGGGGAHNNLQPYIVVYIWKRTL